MPGGRVILFDLGGVLIENTGEQCLRAMLPYELDHGQLWQRWLGSPAVRRFECGRVSAETFAEEFVDEWQLELAPADFIGAFAAWPRGLFEGAEALVRELRARHRVGCLSNNNPVHWARFPELQELFEYKFASHLTGYLKPDREAFEHVLAELDVPADAIYFFDDLPLNVSAARAVGMNAVHVRTFAEVVPALRGLGLY